MSFRKNNERQWPLHAVVDIDYADFQAASLNLAALDIPVNALIVGGQITVNTVFNSTTNGLDFGDATDPDRYTSAVVDLKTLGTTELDGEFLKYPSGATLQMDYTQTGTAPTQGNATLVVAYVIVGRATENQP